MKNLLCLNFFILTFFILTCSNSKQIPPKAVKGVLDLREWDFSPSVGGGDGTIKLDGEWEFYPFMLPDENSELPEERRYFVEVPKVWNGFVYKDENNEIKKMSGVGYGTYRLKILTSVVQVSLKSPNQGTAYSLFCGSEIKLQSGIVGTTQDTSFSSRKIHNPINCETHHGELSLTLSISNFQYSKGGHWLSILLGNYKEIQEKRERSLNLDMFLAGILFIMGSYHVSLFYLRREDKSPIFFGAFCLLISLRTQLTGENYLYTLFPELRFDLGIRLEYLSLYLGLPAFLEFISSLYPLEMNQFLRRFIYWICLPLSIIVILISPLYFTHTLPIVQIALLISILYTFWFLTKAIQNHRSGAVTFLFGFSFFSLTVINDIFHSNQMINTGMYTPLGLVVFIFSQSFLLSARFAKAFHQVNDLTQNLEKKVEERTRTLEEATQTLALANREIANSRKETEDAFQRVKTLNEMVEVIIQSKSTDEIFERIFAIFSEKYGLSSYLVYILDNKDGLIKLYKLFGTAAVDKDYFNILQKNKFSVYDKNSIQGLCMVKNSSFLAKSVRFPHPCEPEEENLIKGEIKAFYIIPLTIDKNSFGTIMFADNKFQSSNIKGLNKNDRIEIENFVRLISPSIYQSLQKNIIDKAYSDLQTTKTELESQKAQMERLQAMSQEIQKKTNYKDMLQILENILWKSYQIGDYILVVHNPLLEEFELVNVSQHWQFHSLDKVIKNIPLSENKSVHKLVFVKKRSLFLPKFKDISNGESEDYNRNLLGMESIFAIPCIVNNESFAVLSFSDVRKEYTKDPMLRGVKRLTHKQRDEIEQLVSLIANPLYQSLQKAQIEKAYSELQETQAQLVEAERLASLGQLVGGIAHEINNPIAVIRSQSGLLANSIHSNLNEIPHFLESLSTTEKGLFYDIVNHSIKNTESFSTKQERAKKKEIHKALNEVLEGSEEEVSFLTEQILLLHLQTPYDPYVKELGVVRFKEFLSNAMIFKNQTNSLSNIEIAVEKASRVVFALRSYLNTDLSLVRKEVNLVEEVEKALHVYDNYVMGKINVRKDFPSELKYTCVPENLSQVWKNLFFNAIQAMYTTEKKLTILIEKKEKLPEELKSYKTSSIVEDSVFKANDVSEWILVSITDSGTGIANDLQPKVFTPFFTTKSLGEGIGLGLYVCKKIIHEHGGTMFFKSGDGITEFVVVLPIN